VYIQKDFIIPETVEKRDFQIKIARNSVKKNTLIVLPTGMGKTIIALILIADSLKKNNKKILFLAPTKPLVNQHASFLREKLDINDDLITIFTGEISPEKRKKNWDKNKIIVSTPQVIENDILSNRINLDDVCFIIFDEAHHAVGDYSYVFISESFKKKEDDHHILGMTASPGNDSNKILEICKNLDIDNIEIRTKYDPDVKPYVHDMKINWRKIDLPKDFALVTQLLKKSLSERLKKLKKIGVIDTSSVSLINKSKLLDAQKKIQSEIRSNQKPSKDLFKAAKIQSESMKIHYAIELLQTQGVESLRNYFQRLSKDASSKNGAKSSRSLITDSNIIEALAHLKNIGFEHPKLEEVLRTVKKQISEKKDSKIIVFTHYRDTSKKVLEVLEKDNKIKPVRFIGQSHRDEDKGLTQKEQSEIIRNFKEDKYNVLVATSVAEEGLDIPSTDLVVFYEPIPSEIRLIQRRGRTGRKMPGKVVILITKGTSDEGYYWASKRKEKRMRSELEFLRSKIKNEIENASSLYHKIQKEKKSQKKIDEFKDGEYNNVKIFVDQREYRSNVVRNLSLSGINIEPKQLDVGDYILSTRIGVERKTVDDYLGSLIDGKLFKQVKKLKENYSRPMLIIEGEGLLTRRNINHKAIFGSLASISVNYGLTVFRTKNELETSDLMSVIATREQREDNKKASIRDGKTAMSDRERQQFIVEGFPNVSKVLAKRLLDYFGSIRDIVNASEEELTKVDGIGKNIAKGIVEVLNKEYLRK